MRKRGDTKLTTQEIKEIVKLYQRGDSIFKISKTKGRNWSTLRDHLEREGVYVPHTETQREEKICACGCKRTFLCEKSRSRQYYSRECYSKDRAKKHKITYQCDKCKKEIPKECAKLNEGKCFMCWFKSWHKKVNKSPT